MTDEEARQRKAATWLGWVGALLAAAVVLFTMLPEPPPTYEMETSGLIADVTHGPELEANGVLTLTFRPATSTDAAPPVEIWVERDGELTPVHPKLETLPNGVFKAKLTAASMGWSGALTVHARLHGQEFSKAFRIRP